MTELDAQELWITVCRLIVYCRLTADTGPVWKSKHSVFNPGYFLLGVGHLGMHKQIYYLLPENRWEDCYFAKEIAAPVLCAEIATAEQMRQRVAELLTFN